MTHGSPTKGVRSTWAVIRPRTSDAARNPIERRPPAGAVERRPDDLGSDRPIVGGQRLVGRPPIGQDGLPSNAFREDAKPVARRTIRPAGEAGTKGMPVVRKSGRRLGWDVDHHGIRAKGFADRLGDSDYVTAV